MPISEDEYDSGRSNEPQSTMSKAELRKTHKPIMEKRRRARINHCLNEIKTLILEAMNKDPARHTKLEKADILEMAVKHLQNVQRQQLAIAMTTDSSVLRKFKNGFNECATEIDRYIGQIEGIDSSMKQRVSNHLQKCMNGIEHVAQLNLPGFSNFPFLAGSSSQSNHVGDQNNNPRLQVPLQLIPSRLPTGELALLVPNSSNMPYFPATVTATIQNRPSAFATVVSGGELPKTLSPPVSPRNPSPHGFRPVLPKSFNDDHQVQQVSSTVPYAQPLEVKTLKFPITRKLESPKKPSDPLCVITNQNERYKQAQMVEETAGFPENAVKRKYPDSLLAVSEYYAPPPKIVKTQLVTPSSSDREDVTKTVSFPKPEPSSSNSNAEGSSDMWRPW